MAKSLLTTQIEEILRRGFSANSKAGVSEVIALEAWLRRALDYIKKMEEDPANAINIETTKRINSLERMLRENNDKYIRKEKGFWKMLADQKKQNVELYAKLPDEEKMKIDFTCSVCDLVWSREFLRMTDKNGSNYCWECVEQGTRTAGEDTGQEIVVEATSRTRAVKAFTCEFCGIKEVGVSIKTHIINAPDNRPSDEIIRLCKDCSMNKAKKDYKIAYCPRRTAPRDDINLPEYDCKCPRKEKYQADW